jgi:hypothetical protein
MQGEPTLMRVLLTRRHWQKWPTFEAQFRRAAKALAEQEAEPELAKTVVSARQFERWYSGSLKTLPRPDACRVLEFMFGHAITELLAAAKDTTLPAGQARTGGGTGIGMSGRSASGRNEPNFDMSTTSVEEPYSVSFEGNEEADVRRRELLGSLSAALAGAPFAELERLRRGVDSILSAPSTNGDADDWERTAASYAHEVGVLPPVDLLPRLLSDFGEAGTRLANSSGHVRHRLAHVVAQLGALTAITFVNLGDQHTADRWWRTAARAADEAGDYRASSLIRGRRAVFSLYGRPTETVLRLADEAIITGRNSACAGVASGYAARAHALAKLGRADEARQALRDLTNVFEHLPAEISGDRWSAWGWSEWRLRHTESYVYTHSGDISAASRAQDAALVLYPEARYQGRAQVEMHRAECLIRAGDIDSGAKHAATILGMLSSEQRGDALVTSGALAALAAVPVQELRRPAVQDARELLALPASPQ